MMTVLQVSRTRGSSGPTRTGRLLLLERSDGRTHAMGDDAPDRKNEELSEHPVQAMQLFASEGNPDLRPRPGVFVDNPVRPATQFRGGLPPHVVRQLREHIDSNIDQRIRVAALAKLANLSVCYFARAFKQSVGVTPHDYLMRRRVERTIELLSGTKMSLSEIAFAAGFADQSHFARRFRQHVGMSPRDYRRATPLRMT